VDKIKDIRWDDSLFKKVELQEIHKEAIGSFLSTYEKSQVDDFVPGKGLGFILNFAGESHHLFNFNI